VNRRSTLVLTPGIGGADGISVLSCEVVSALTRLEAESKIEVWSLADRPADGSPVRSARGSRLRYGWWGLEEGSFRQHRRTVVTLHTHLLPVTLALVYRGARLVHFLVGIEAWKPLSPLQAAALRRAERLVAISRHSETEFRRANPSFGRTEIAVCHPGLPDLVDSDEIGDMGYALIVGRMSKEERYKGHDMLLDIWSEVGNRHPGAELTVVGDGDDRPRLEAKARGLGVEKAVRFLGRVPGVELERLYRHCAFFVMPSRHEGFGFGFLEAMRAGKACIGAQGAASEIIEDGVTGYVVDAEDPGAVTSAIEKLLIDPVARERMGSIGRQRFKARFTRERFEERLGALF